MSLHVNLTLFKVQLLQDYSVHSIIVNTTCDYNPIWWPYDSAWFLTLATQCHVNYLMILSVSPICWILGTLILFLLDINCLRLRNNPELCLKCSNPSSVLVCFTAGLIPCCSCHFIPYICCSLVMEFKMALGYFVHSIFPVKAATLGFTC